MNEANSDSFELSVIHTASNNSDGSLKTSSFWSVALERPKIMSHFLLIFFYETFTHIDLKKKIRKSKSFIQRLSTFGHLFLSTGIFIGFVF